MTLSANLTTARDMVENRFDLAEIYADEAWALATAQMEALSSISFDREAISLDFDFDPISTGDYAPTRPTRTITEPSFIAPTSPSFEDVSITPVDVPSLAANPPSISLPASPTVTWPTGPGDRPTTSDPDIPTKPSYTLPSVPSLVDIPIASSPDITLPSFSGVLPDNDIEAPGNIFVYNEAVYSSTLSDAISSKLEADVEDGGTGLGATVEAAIWARLRARQATLNERTYNEALDFFASKGWTIPPGALGGRITEALTEQTKADAQANYEIAIEQARLAQNNTQFAVTAGISLENQLIIHANNVAGRAFESAKYVQDAAVLVFNAKVTFYNMELQTYQATASVYESQIRAQLLLLEKFKAELEGSKLTGDIQRNSVDLYRAQIASVEALMGLYRVEMDSARIVSDVERLKLEAFREEVNAYSAELGGITARYNAYQYQISGEAEKVRVYAEQVRAYSAEVDGVKASSDINIAEAGIAIAANKDLIDKYRAEIDKYTADANAAIGLMNAEARAFGAEAQMYDADVRLSGVKMGADIESYTAARQHETNLVAIALEEAKANLDAAIRTYGIQVEAAKGLANVGSQMTAAALNAVNASATFGYRGASTSTTSRTDPSAQHRYVHQLSS